MPLLSLLVSLLVLISCSGAPLRHLDGATSQADLKEQESDLLLRDFSFQSGEKLSGLRIHYRTLGVPRRDGAGQIDNAVLLLHGSVNNGGAFLSPSMAGPLFAPGAPLDAGKFFLILPDNIGAGGSSKPSEGLRGRFPRYGLRDQLHAHKALLDKLDVKRVKLILGISAGGMAAWLWGQQYPDLMEALVPIASTPAQISGRNLIWRELILRAIRLDPKWRGGKYKATSAPSQWRQLAAPVLHLMLQTPEVLQAAAPSRSASLAEYDRLVESLSKTDASDWYHAWDMTHDYDPAPGLSRIKARVLAINFSDDEMNPVSLIDLRMLPKATLEVVEGGRGHLSMVIAEAWAKPLGAFLNRSFK